MVPPGVRKLGFVLVVISSFWAGEPGVGQDSPGSSAAQWLPDSSVVCIQIRDLGSAWQEIESSTVVEEILKLPDVVKGMDDKQFRQALLGKKFVENLVGQDLASLVRDLTETPAVIAIDSSREAAVIFEPTQGTFERLQEMFSGFASLGSLASDGPALKAVQYKGVQAYAVDKARVAFHSGRIVLCSGNTIGKAILDRALGETKTSLAQSEWYRSATRLMAEPSAATTTQITAVVNLKWFRDQGQLKLPQGDDVGQELLVGGVLDVVKSADTLAFEAALRDRRLSLRASVPLTDPITETRQYFFGSERLVASPNPSDLPNRIMSARWHRDIGDFWKMIPQIVKDENVLAGVAKSESEIATLFGGMVTVGDLFDYIGPGLELVACQPNFESAESKPDIQTPPFGIVGSLRDADRADKALRLAFQQVVSFSNLNAGAGKYPPLEVTSEKVGSARYLTASYLALDSMMMQAGDQSDTPSSNLYLNFSPTLAIDGTRFVLASDRKLAESLLKSGSRDYSNGSVVDNSVIEFWPRAVAELARLNFEPLIAQRMLETGQNRDAAEREVKLGLTIAQCFERIGLRLSTVQGRLVLEGSAEFATR